MRVSGVAARSWALMYILSHDKSFIGSWLSSATPRIASPASVVHRNTFAGSPSQRDTRKDCECDAMQCSEMTICNNNVSFYFLRSYHALNRRSFPPPLPLAPQHKRFVVAHHSSPPQAAATAAAKSKWNLGVLVATTGPASLPSSLQAIGVGLRFRS